MGTYKNEVGGYISTSRTTRSGFPPGKFKGSGG